jgi:uncharacterized glyoxalase superfamily protein PhnB
MIANRSIPDAVVIPELGYPDVRVAADWLARAFGFRTRLRIADHRVQIEVPGGGAIVAVDAATGPSRVLVRVADAHGHHARAVAAGAEILRAPADHPYGERQYTARDPGGHQWTFSQSLADVDPASWGGELA